MRLHLACLYRVYHLAAPWISVSTSVARIVPSPNVAPSAAADAIPLESYNNLQRLGVFVYCCVSRPELNGIEPNRKLNRHPARVVIELFHRHCLLS